MSILYPSQLYDTGTFGITACRATATNANMTSLYSSDPHWVSITFLSLEMGWGYLYGHRHSCYKIIRMLRDARGWTCRVTVFVAYECVGVFLSDTLFEPRGVMVVPQLRNICKKCTGYFCWTYWVFMFFAFIEYECVFSLPGALLILKVTCSIPSWATSFRPTPSDDEHLFTKDSIQFKKKSILYWPHLNCANISPQDAF